MEYLSRVLIEYYELELEQKEARINRCAKYKKQD